MSFLNKLGLGMTNGTSRGGSLPVHSSSRSRTPSGPVSAVGATRAPESPESTRVSNGLKEFLWNLDGLGRGTLLDLGPAWQTTLSFFIERGFRVSSEDFLRGWKAFLTDDEKRLREDADARDKLDMTPNGSATRFLAENLQYPRASAKGLSEPRDPGPLYPLPDHEIVCRPRPTARDTFHQVTTASYRLPEYRGNRAFTLCSLALDQLKEYKRNVSSLSSGGTMTPPDLELHYS